MNIYRNMKPVIKGFKTVWEPEYCERCGSNVIEEYEKDKYRCERCKKIIEKER